MTDPLEFKTRLAEAIRLLYDDAAIIGDSDRLDFTETGVAASGANT
jgi:type III restriction enzyme